MPRCPECEITYPLSDFGPRDTSVYERDIVPPFESIPRQSRCAPCNRVYQSRRRFLLKALQPRARELGARVTVVAGSVYRRVVLTLSRRAREGAREELLRLVGAFNDDLPIERCDVSRHGILAEAAAPARRPRPAQRQLFPPRTRRAK